MRRGASLPFFAGIALAFAVCGARAGEAPEAACRDMAGDYRVAETFVAREFLPLARGVLAEVTGGRVKDDDGQSGDPVLSVRLTEGVFTISALDRSAAAEVAEEPSSAEWPCWLQLADSTTYISRADLREATGEQVEQLARALSYQWFAKVTPERARSLEYAIIISVSLVGVTNGAWALIVPLERIEERAVRQDRQN
ncbi:MAG: hypothetical protein LBU11_10615 [Zoogloeaceae bacterium]|jgi:hypothetical protein|nr:hypothetical protein [Zoogloeaceae bacterium]